MGYNQIILTGNLGQDWDVKTLSSGSTVAKNSLAVQRDYKPEGAAEYEVDWFYIELWGQQASYMAQYAPKGSVVLISGQMQNRKYTAQDGTQRSVWEVKGQKGQILRQAQPQAAQQPAQAPAPQAQPAPAPQPQTAYVQPPQTGGQYQQQPAQQPYQAPAPPDVNNIQNPFWDQ